MSKDDTQHALVPRLRFPEFRERWREVQLQDVAAESTTRNGTDSSPKPIMGVTKAEGIVPMEERLIAADTARYKLVRKNWFAYNPMRLNIGSIARWQGDHDILVSPDYVVFRCLDDETPSIDPDYLDHFRQSDQWDHFVTESGIGSVRVRIYFKDIGRLSLPLPPPAEQQKIAECLGSLDDLIAAEGRKLAALRNHKQGLMQQLFPREGETQPRLRFPEFRDAGDWKVIRLAELLARDPEYGVNAAAVPYSEDLPAYIRITDIDDDGRYLPAGRVSVDIEATDDEYLQEGDIVLARTGASVGKSYRYQPEDGRLVFAGFLIRVRPEPTKLDSRFLAAYLSTGQYWDWVRVTSARSGQPGINGSEYASMPLPVPPDDDSNGEQKKIADCLSALDARIAAQAEKLDALRTHKRGLMQQLFPSPEDVQA